MMFEAESVVRSRGGRHRNMSVLGLFSDYLPCHQRTRTRSLQQAPWGRLRVSSGCGREGKTPLSWVGGELLLGRWGTTTGWYRMVACQRNRGPDLSASLCRRIQFPAPAFLLTEDPSPAAAPSGREGSQPERCMLEAPRCGSARLSARSPLRKRMFPFSPLSASCPG